MPETLGGMKTSGLKAAACLTVLAEEVPVPMAAWMGLVSVQCKRSPGHCSKALRGVTAEVQEDLCGDAEPGRPRAFSSVYLASERPVGETAAWLGRNHAIDCDGKSLKPISSLKGNIKFKFRSKSSSSSSSRSRPKARHDVACFPDDAHHGRPYLLWVTDADPEMVRAGYPSYVQIQFLSP